MKSGKIRMNVVASQWRGVAKKWKEWKLKREWRKGSTAQFPLRYTGPNRPFIQYGLPLAMTSGPRGGQYAKRYIDPNGVERVLHPKDTSKR